VSPNGIVFLSVLILAFLIAVLLDLFLRPALRGLVEQIIELPAATDFYLRAFILVVFLAVLSVAAGTHPDLKDSPHFMEYVWSVAGRLQEVLQNLLIVLLVYVALIVVLTAALRRKQ